LQNQWSYESQEFICGAHGNRFGIDGNNVVNCGSGNTQGDLLTYSATLSGESLTIITT
tara:strand:- start:3310 stop:3483 length:174 start_codon:yes stop_codon:yes gene_type:complete